MRQRPWRKTPTYAEEEISSAERAHLLSNGKIAFQSFFMLMTVQSFFFASVISA